MKNKNVIITGGLGHLGEEICNKISELNCNIIVVDKNLRNKIKKILNLKKKYKNKIHFIDCDISSEIALNRINKRINKKFKYIDTIINNAAYYENDKGFSNKFTKEKYKSWEKVFKVNLFAPFFLTQKLYKLLLKSKNPSIINIGSIYGSIAPDFNLYKNTKMNNPASYNASKGALVQLTRWMSSYLAPNIRTNMVSPGGIYRNQNNKFLKKYNLKNPMKRMATEKDVAEIILFLISDKANYLNGQNIFVDGGFSNL